MKIKNVLVYAILLFLLNLCLLEAKKVLVTLIGLHALRRMQGMQHMRDFVTIYLPLRHVTKAWKAFGAASAHMPPFPKFLHGHHEGGLRKHIKLSEEEGFELDNWLNYHFPEEGHGYRR